MAKNMLTKNFSEPLNGARTARIDVHVGDGNLIMDGLINGEQVLAHGTLQYLEKQGMPVHTLESNNGETLLTVRGGSGQPWFRMPWSACNGATVWQIHLNPAIATDLMAHSHGGNVKLDLSEIRIASLSADTGGGNMEVILPQDIADLHVAARTGAGTVTVHVPGNVAARIHATTGMGKVTIDPRFIKTDDNTYQSPDFEGAAHRVEMTLHSGAGTVTVRPR